MVVEQLALITQKGVHCLSHKIGLSQVAEHLVSQGLCYLCVCFHVAERDVSGPLLSISIHVGTLV